jgi:hypothetical protein
MGASALVQRLEALALAHGERFAPCPALVEHARAGLPYYAS